MMGATAKKWPMGAYVYLRDADLLFFSQITAEILGGSMAAYPWHKRAIDSISEEEIGALVKTLVTQSRYAVSDEDFLAEYQGRDPLMEAFEANERTIGGIRSRCGLVSVDTGWEHEHYYVEPQRLKPNSGHPLNGDFPPLPIDASDEALGSAILERVKSSANANRQRR